MSLKGTQTEKNLWSAFSGESQARNKYIAFCQRAQEEGNEEIARVFKNTAEQEEEHAINFLKFLGGINDTMTNLRRAVEGEHYETTTLYKEFERVALEEGFVEIATYFKNLRIIEAEHEKRYLELIQQLKKEMIK